MSKREDKLLVDDILNSMQRIVEYTSEITFVEFQDSLMIQDAVVRNFTIIGEAAGNFSDKFMEMNSQIPFREMKDFRNKIVHNYAELNYNLIWDLIQLELPHLKEELSKVKF